MRGRSHKEGLATLPPSSAAWTLARPNHDIPTNLSAPGGPPSQDPDALWSDAMLDDLHDAEDDDPLNLGLGLDDDPPPPPAAPAARREEDQPENLDVGAAHWASGQTPQDPNPPGVAAVPPGTAGQTAPTDLLSPGSLADACAAHDADADARPALAQAGRPSARGNNGSARRSQ